MKEVKLQALADQQVRPSSLRTHPGFAPYRAGETRAADRLGWDGVGESEKSLEGMRAQPASVSAHLLSAFPPFPASFQPPSLSSLLVFSSSLPPCLPSHSPCLPPSLLSFLAHLLITYFVPDAVLCTGAQRWVRQGQLLLEEDLESYCTPHNFHLFPEVISEPGHRPLPRYRNCARPLPWPFCGLEPTSPWRKCLKNHQPHPCHPHFWGPG